MIGCDDAPDANDESTVKHDGFNDCAARPNNLKSRSRLISTIYCDFITKRLRHRYFHGRIVKPKLLLRESDRERVELGQEQRATALELGDQCCRIAASQCVERVVRRRTHQQLVVDALQVTLLLNMKVEIDIYHRKKLRSTVDLPGLQQRRSIAAQFGERQATDKLLCAAQAGRPEQAKVTLDCDARGGVARERCDVCSARTNESRRAKRVASTNATLSSFVQ